MASRPGTTPEVSMKKILKLMAALAVVASTAAWAPAQAAEVYGDLAPPGVYFGSGNSNGGFWVSNGEGGELGLRIKNRDTGLPANGNNVDHIYRVDPGLCVGGNGCTAGTRAKGSYEFSVNRNDQLPTAFTYWLAVDNDPTVSENLNWVNAATYWPDNAISGDGFQNSQNFVFPGTPGGAIDPFLQGLFSIYLEARDGNGRAIQTLRIVEQVGDNVPVSAPATLALAGLGIGALIVLRRRKNGPGALSVSAPRPAM